MTATPADFRGYCLNCSYDLRGLPAPRCPECGRVFDPVDRTTYRDTPSPERLYDVLSRTATALMEGLEMLNPADPENLRRVRLERRIGELQRSNADLRLLVELLAELLVNKGVLRSEELEDLRLRAAELAGSADIEVVDDTQPPAEDVEPTPDLIDLGRAIGKDEPSPARDVH